MALRAFEAWWAASLPPVRIDYVNWQLCSPSTLDLRITRRVIYRQQQGTLVAIGTATCTTLMRVQTVTAP